MLTTIELQNFKGFKDTKIEPLRKVNLLIGGQNVGKTSVLEAVYAVTKPDTGEELAKAFRIVDGNDAQRYLASSFPKEFRMIQVETEKSQYKLANVSWKLRRLSKLKDEAVSNLDWGFLNEFGIDDSWTMSPMAFSVYLPAQATLNSTLGRVVMRRQKKALLQVLKEVEPRLEDINDASPDGEHRIYVELEGVAAALPLPQLGHGFSRLLSLFAEIYANDSQLALIDEIENGIHYSALPTLFQGIKAVAKERDVQSIITTHSWDCLRAACEVFEDSPDLFQVIRLERHGDDIQAVCIDGERMQRLMADDREVR